MFFMKFSFSLLVVFVVVSVAIFLSGCTGQPVCGDGVCEYLEMNPSSPFYCSQDCGVKEPVCGDGVCHNLEKDSNSQNYCPEDCEEVCPDVWEPVCGVDGVTYNNDCYADLEGVEVDYAGECVDEELDLDVEMVISKDEFVVGEEVQLR
jgi:hypothetical protein